MPGASILSVGDAAAWTGHADLVLTNPYGPLPACLHAVPAIVSNFAERKARCEAWIGGRPLLEVSAWGEGMRNRVWVAGLAVLDLDLTDLTEDHDGLDAAHGWFPLALPMRLLAAYGQPGWTVWDGFMGRGTTGRAALELGMTFVGIDRDPARVALATGYVAGRS